MLHEAKRRFYSFKQERSMTCSVYLEKFKNMIQVIETAGGEIGNEPGLIKKELEELDPPVLIADATPEQRATALVTSKEKYHAMIFLMNSDRNRYGKMIEEMENEYLKGFLTAFPVDVVEMYRVMVNWKCDPKQLARILDDGVMDGVSFLMMPEKTEKIEEDAVAEAEEVKEVAVAAQQK